jgi:eukaryotic-like serine/threonine-protein kinase
VPEQSLIGSKIAGYTIDSEVGEGGTSAVYRASHPGHGTVALKVLREKLRNDRTAVARFVREAQFGSRVLHPNVVRTIEIGESDNGLHFLAIEWAEGQLLERYARQHAPLPPEEVAGIISQIGAAVHAAHHANVVHRDLKPENVMYNPLTKQVKLLDFGIATDTQSSADERLTRAGFFVGSLMYVAPEALSGELVGPSADQYSLATIAYYLLTRCLPYTAKAPREMFTQLLTMPPVPLNAAKERLRFSPKIESVTMRALAKDPAGRYRSVMDFTNAFAEAVREGAEPSAPVAAAGTTAGTPDSSSGLFSRVRGILRRGS